MTIIIASIDNGIITMGGDHLVSSVDHSNDQYVERKVFKGSD